MAVLHSVLQMDRVSSPLVLLPMAKAKVNPFSLEELAKIVREQADLDRPVYYNAKTGEANKAIEYLLALLGG